MKYTHEQQKKALEIASKVCGLDSHITILERKSDMQTLADRIIGIFYRKMMPIKRSYMFCDTLDMTFYFLTNGKAVYTYAGYADERDANDKIEEAFKLANRMRKEMQKAIENTELLEQEG